MGSRAPGKGWSGPWREAGREALLEEMSDVEKAAMVIHEAMLLQSSEDYPNHKAAWRTYQCFHRFCHLSEGAVWLLLLLSAFETPLWCDESGLWEFRSAAQRCGKGIPEGELYLSGVPMLPVGYGLVVELSLLALVCWKTLMLRRLQRFFREAGVGGGYLTTPRGMRFDILMIGLGLLDAAFYACCPWASFRATPYVRFGLAASLPRVKGIVTSFCSVLAAIRTVGIFLAGVICIFALMAAMVLDDSTELNTYGDPVNTGFETFTDAIYTSFVAMTTASLPDAVVNTYVHSKAMFWLWWLPFLLLGACLFTQVVLATVYNRYEEDTTERLKERYKQRDEGILVAFDYMQDCRTVDGHSGISYSSFEVLVEKLRTLSFPIAIEVEVVEAAFKALDSDYDGVISSFEFFEMVDLLQHRFKRTRRDSIVRKLLEGTPPGRVLRFIMDNGAEGPDLGYSARYHGSICDRCMSLVLGANTVWVIVQCVVDLNDFREPPWFSLVNIFFSFVYLVEVALKLCYWSWGQYWLIIDNRFDFVTTMILAGVGVAFLLFNVDKAILQYFNMVRLMRIVRLLKALNNIPSYRMQVDVITKMVGTCWDVLMMNVLVIYLWSAVGNQLFGGELYASNPKLQQKDLTYFSSHYQIYNFNDLALGSVTLFFCMLGSWNDALASACMGLSRRMTPSWFLAGFFHLSFYIASPLLAFNVYTAFSIDVFCQLKEFTEEEDSQEIGLVRNLRGTYMAEMASRGYCLHIEETSEFSRMKVQRSMIEVDDSDNRLGEYEAAVSRIEVHRSSRSFSQAAEEAAAEAAAAGAAPAATSACSGSPSPASESALGTPSGRTAMSRRQTRHLAYREKMCAEHREASRRSLLRATVDTVVDTVVEESHWAVDLFNSVFCAARDREVAERRVQLPDMDAPGGDSERGAPPPETTSPSGRVERRVLLPDMDSQPSAQAPRA